MENLLNQAEGLGETWMPRTLAAKASLSTMHPYSWLGKGEPEPRGKWVPENSLGEGGYVGQGEGKENMEGNALLAVRMQCSFFSGDFRAFHCGHLKAGGGLGQNCKALAAPIGLWLASSPNPTGGNILVGCTVGHVLSAPCKAWPWSQWRRPPMHCPGSTEGPDPFPTSPPTGVASRLRHSTLSLFC